MKANIEAGILALQGFYQVVNTKEKAFILILLWWLITMSGLTWRFASVESVERLMKVHYELKHSHQQLEVKQSTLSTVATEKTNNSTKPMGSN